MTKLAATLDGFSSARAMLAALHYRKVSAAELLEYHLERIARYNPTLNAIVTSNEEQARQQAAAADAAYARGGSPGLLQGLPLTIKDTLEVAGLPATAGVPANARRIPSRNGPVAQRVLDAGGVLLGKTNIPPYAGDWHADNPLFGRTKNPWDLSRTPGGSTGGGAAALAAGLTPLEFGSDLAGSIRIPAAFCGLYGHRPSETAVPRYGHFPGSPVPNAAAVMSVQGPLARTADDLALALDAIAGPIVGEDVAWRLELPPARHTALADFRVAILPYADWLPVDNEIKAALDDLASRLSKLGAKVAEAQPEGFDLWKHEEQFVTMLNILMFAELRDETRAKIAEGMRQSTDPFGPAQLKGVTASAVDLLKLHSKREYERAAFRAFFYDWDLLLTPVTITPAFEHPDLSVSFPKRTLQINGQAVPYGRLQVYPGLASFSGLPATAFPAGRTSNGLPIGLQAIGPYLEDRTTITFAALLEREFGGFTPPAGFSD